MVLQHGGPGRDEGVVTVCNLTARCRAAPLRVNQTNKRVNRKANKNAEWKRNLFLKITVWKFNAGRLHKKWISSLQDLCHSLVVLSLKSSVWPIFYSAACSLINVLSARNFRSNLWLIFLCLRPAVRQRWSDGWRTSGWPSTWRSRAAARTPTCCPPASLTTVSPSWTVRTVKSLLCVRESGPMI